MRETQINFNEILPSTSARCNQCSFRFFVVVANMMKALFLLVVLVVSCQAADWSWSSCGSGHYQVQRYAVVFYYFQF